MPVVPTTHHVPYCSQWESPDLVADFLCERLAASADPLWHRSGATDREEYEFWSWRICGMACLRMALTHWGYDTAPLVEMAGWFLAAGAYVCHHGRLEGLIYAPFAAYVTQRWGVTVTVRSELGSTELPGL